MVFNRTQWLHYGSIRPNKLVLPSYPPVRRFPLLPPPRHTCFFYVLNFNPPTPIPPHPHLDINWDRNDRAGKPQWGGGGRMMRVLVISLRRLLSLRLVPLWSFPPLDYPQCTWGGKWEQTMGERGGWERVWGNVEEASWRWGRSGAAREQWGEEGGSWFLQPCAARSWQLARHAHTHGRCCARATHTHTDRPTCACAHHMRSFVLVCCRDKTRLCCIPLRGRQRALICRCGQCVRACAFVFIGEHVCALLLWMASCLSFFVVFFFFFQWLLIILFDSPVSTGAQIRFCHFETRLVSAQVLPEKRVHSIISHSCSTRNENEVAFHLHLFALSPDASSGETLNSEKWAKKGRILMLVFRSSAAILPTWQSTPGCK